MCRGATTSTSTGRWADSRGLGSVVRALRPAGSGGGFGRRLETGPGRRVRSRRNHRLCPGRDVHPASDASRGPRRPGVPRSARPTPGATDASRDRSLADRRGGVRLLRETRHEFPGVRESVEVPCRWRRPGGQSARTVRSFPRRCRRPGIPGPPAADARRSGTGETELRGAGCRAGSPGIGAGPGGRARDHESPGGRRPEPPAEERRAAGATCRGIRPSPPTWPEANRDAGNVAARPQSVPDRGGTR